MTCDKGSKHENYFTGYKRVLAVLQNKEKLPESVKNKALVGL